MGGKLLNDSYKFKCQFASRDNLKLVIAQRMAADKGRLYLTEADILVASFAECRLQPNPGAPGSFLPCIYVHTNWLNVENKVRVNHFGALTDKSFVICCMGSKIPPSDGSGISCVGATELAVKADNATTEQGKVSAAPVASVAATSAAIAANSLVENAPKDNSTTANKAVMSQEYCLCDYKNCGRTEQCDYYNAGLGIDNNALKLRKNYCQVLENEWNQYLALHEEKNRESQNGNWKTAAHHIISGNQVLLAVDRAGKLKYGGLVRLANFLGYDINNALNCIMLPTNEKGFGDNENIVKFAKAYDVMGLMKKQWHSGGHAYSLDKQTLDNLIKYWNKNPSQYPRSVEGQFFACYRDALQVELDKMASMSKYSRPKCWLKNKKRLQTDFIKDMNRISQKVKDYLCNFEANPRTSFPFYVSKLSVEYSFDLPATGKVIVIYQNKDKGISAKRYRVERYFKNDLQVVLNEKATLDVTNSTKRDFILFCENVMHFLLAKDLNYALPFASHSLSDEDVKKKNGDLPKGPLVRHIVINDQVTTQLNSKANELVAFLKLGEFYYQPIVQVCNKRLKEGGVI